jgi:hypothetical protein
VNLEPLVRQFGTTLKLHLRNTMALIYSYLFPTIFLVAFWVLYRFEEVPLVRHMGELLTVTALGGACFGLPTTMVSERERGVWRRYRLAPVSTATLLGGTVAARYVLLLVAALLQIGLAMAIGMPMPRHPIDLLLAFTLVAFAFIGLGLVIAMMADNVPAVQALGQCIFLPMLIIGGVAVPLTILPEWAQRLSSFFPGRYAVETLQSAVTGDGLAHARFGILALLAIGAAGSIAGAMMFRWDAEQRFSSTPGKGWVAVALAAWVAVGLAAEARGRTPRREAPAPVAQSAPPAAPSPTDAPQEPSSRDPAPSTTPPAPAVEPTPPTPRITPPPVTPDPSTKAPTPVPALPPTSGSPAPTSPPASAPPAPTMDTGRPPATWRAVTMADIERDLIFTRLPPDEGVVTPIARSDEEPDDQTSAQLERMRLALPTWEPGKVQDPVQRVRNFLYVAAVPDVFQMTDLEKFVPYVVYDQIQQDVPKEDLIKILYWIALHPFEGDDKAVDQLRPLGLFNGPADMQTTRDRLSVYAVKLLGRITGKITPQ